MVLGEKYAKARSLSRFSGVRRLLARRRFAQTPAKVYRLGTLTPGATCRREEPFWRSSCPRAGAARLFGRAKPDYRCARRGRAGQPPSAITSGDETGKVDAVVIVGYPTAAPAAKVAGIPAIIASGGGDLVATGLIDSLARPGGNITGISDNATTLSTKRLSLLKQLLPNMRRVAMLWNRDDLGMSLRYDASAKAAQEMGVSVQALGVREPDDFNGVFTAMDKEPPDAILMVSDALTILNRKRVYEYAAAKRLPAIYENDSLVRDGGLSSYGADPKGIRERAADFSCAHI